MRLEGSGTSVSLIATSSYSIFKPLLCAISVCSFVLLVMNSQQKVNHRDTEHTEIAQRNHQGAIPSSIHCLNNATCACGHGSSHGMLPSSRRAWILAACILTSS